MHKLLLLFAIVTVFLFVGCEAFMDFNLTESFDKVEIDTADLAGMEDDDEVLQQINAAIETGTLEDLDETERNDIQTRLEAIQNDPDASTQQKQDAAVTEVKIHFVANPEAKETIDNIVDVALSLADGTDGDDGTSSSNEVAQLLGGLFPEDSSQDNVADIITTMSEVGSTYETYNDLLSDPNQPPPEGIEGIAQEAVIAVAVKTISDLDGDGEVSPQEASSAAGELVKILGDPDATIDENNLNLTAAESVFSASADGTGPIDNILNESGLADLFSGFIPEDDSTQ